MLVLLAAVLVSGMLCGPVRADDQVLVDRAGALIETFAQADVFQGVVLMTRGDEVLFEAAYGQANREFGVPNRLDTVFQIASVSKPFTSAAIFLLEERGLVDLDAPLALILPDYPRGDVLTLDHLLTHTSGIPNINSFDEYEDWSKDHFGSARELVELFQDRPLEFEPGTSAAYSNSNYELLAHVIESIAGVGYGEFLRTEIFEPLGMSSTGHRGDPAAIIPGLATGYAPVGARGFGRAQYTDWTVKTGNGSLYSTANDLWRFHRALRDGELLKPASLARDYGFERELGGGWGPGEAHGRRIVTATGRSPGYVAHFKRFIDDDLCLIILSNLYLGPPSQMIRALTALVAGEDYEDPGFQVLDNVDAEQLEPFTGGYRFGDDWFVGAVEVIVENRADHLVVRYLDGEYVDYEFLLIPLGEALFFDRTHGGLVRFSAVDGGGGPLRLTYELGREIVAEPVP